MPSSPPVERRPDVTNTIEQTDTTYALSVENLQVRFRAGKDWRLITRGIDLAVRPGQTLGIVGESGSGKSVTAQALAGLAAPRGGRVTWDSFTIGGSPVRGDSEKEWRSLRGKRVSMIFQHPSQALNPAFHVGDQIADVVRRHREDVSRSEAKKIAIELMDRVGIVKPAERAKQYPHTLSGGMCQRIAIAIALAASPDVLIADEPTTALDVTVQARILNLLNELQAELGLAIVMISHDLAVVGEVADHVAVMYAGEVIEWAPCEDIFDNPSHPYTRGLLASQPRRGEPMRGIAGLPPVVFDRPGCAFAPRCDQYLAGPCDASIPLTSISAKHLVRCERHLEVVS